MKEIGTCKMSNVNIRTTESLWNECSEKFFGTDSIEFLSCYDFSLLAILISNAIVAKLCGKELNARFLSVPPRKLAFNQEEL